MLYVHERMAELWLNQKKRSLTVDEEMEMIHCLQLNADYTFKMTSLYELSLIAYSMDDVEWHHEICRQIEALENTFKIKKSAAKKRTDKE